jgi:NADH dehydrogenase [ubiquinone] 1 alpha subcomplex assembly factor 2
MKILAAQADARWEAKPRVMEDVVARGEGVLGVGVGEPALETGGRVGPPPGGEVVREEEGGTMVSGTAAQPAAAAAAPAAAVAEEVEVGDGEAVGQREETWKRMRQEASAKGAEVKQDPWRQTRRGAGESWQPKAWAPAPSGKK